jgi:hypothetical protein
MSTPSSPPGPLGGSALPSPHRERARRGRRRLASSAALQRLSVRIIAAVNERGLCAVELARLAELPESEIAQMRRDCVCPACFAARAN